MNATSPHDQDASRISKLLSESGVAKIVVIDDAYDPPVRDDLTPGDIESFWAETQLSSAAKQELSSIGFKGNSPDDIDNLLIQKLWEKRDALGPLKPICEKGLFQVIGAKYDYLEEFSKYLTDDLGLEIRHLGSKHDAEQAKGGLVFIDYYLGPTQDPESVNRSVNAAKNIYAACSGVSAKPIFILMSSKPVNQNMIDDFRDRSGLLGGMFYFVVKEHLADRTKLLLHLGAFVIALPTGHTIQRLVEAFGTAIQETSDKFLKAIQTLSLADYAYIQKLSLQEDGHPLGDYMLWLYGAYFGHLLFESSRVRTEREALDKLNFNDLPLIQTEPSQLLTEIYKTALFDLNVGDVGAHPQASTDEQDATCEAYLHLGDFFFKDVASDVWMVINAQCDLAFAPGSAQRPFKSERSVLVIPGRLKPIETPIEAGDRSKPRTELFDHEGIKYRIIWDTRRVSAVEYGKIREWQKAKGYKRIARLRLPYALEVQSAFAGDLTRVGTPVAPPFFQPVTVYMYCAGVDAKSEELGKSAPSSCFCFMTTRGHYCLLGIDFVCQIDQAIDDAISRLSKRIEDLKGKEDKSDSKMAQRIEKAGVRASRLVEFKKTIGGLLYLRSPFALPGLGGSCKLKLAPIIVARIKTVDPNYDYEEPLLLNVVEG